MTLSRAIEAHDRALHGDFVELEAARDALGDEPAGQALRQCLDGVYGLVAPARAGDVDTEALASLLVDADAAPFAADALGHAAVAALLAFDGERVAELASLFRGVDDERVRPAAARIGGFAALMAGDAESALTCAREATIAAKAARSAHGLVEAATLQSLAHLGRGALDEATAVARRASRMARTERLLAQEYLANLALARVRRYAGRAHLAGRIASALDQVAPAPWRSWLRWELSLSGQRVASAGDESAGALLAGLLDAAERGDAAQLDRRAERCRTATRGFAPIAAEANALILLTDPRSGAEVDATVGPFPRADACRASLRISGCPSTPSQR